MILRVCGFRWHGLTHASRRGCPPSLERLAVAKAMASSLRLGSEAVALERGAPYLFRGSLGAGAVALERGPLYYYHGLLVAVPRHEAGVTIADGVTFTTVVPYGRKFNG